MATSWPSGNAEDFLSGELVKEGGAHMWDIIQCMFRRGPSLDLGNASSATTSWVAGTTDTWLVPPHAVAGMKIKIWAKVTRTGGTTAYYRASETGGPTNGTEQGTTAASEWLGSEITIPDGTWAGAEKTFELQARGDAGGSSSLASVDNAGCYVWITD